MAEPGRESRGLRDILSSSTSGEHWWLAGGRVKGRPVSHSDTPGEGGGGLRPDYKEGIDTRRRPGQNMTSRLSGRPGSVRCSVWAMDPNPTRLLSEVQV